MAVEGRGSQEGVNREPVMENWRTCDSLEVEANGEERI